MHQTLPFEQPQRSDEEAGMRPGSSLLERWWAVWALGVLTAWGAVSYLLFMSVGWWGRSVMLGAYATSVIAIVAVVRYGSKDDDILDDAFSGESETDGSEDCKAA